MKKSKLTIGIILLVIGILSFVFVPGGFIKQIYQEKPMEYVTVTAITIDQEQLLSELETKKEELNKFIETPAPIPLPAPMMTPFTLDGSVIPLSQPLDIEKLRDEIIAEKEMEIASLQAELERTSEMKVVGSAYNSGKTIFYEIYGIIKDLLSLVTTIYGIMIAKKTLLENKKA